MIDYLFLMHDDAQVDSAQDRDAAWQQYFAMLRASGRFSGGSSIGAGLCVAKSGIAKQISSHLCGYIRVQAESLENARELLAGNPVFESGGTVEIRELPRD